MKDAIASLTRTAISLVSCGSARRRISLLKISATLIVLSVVSAVPFGNRPAIAQGEAGLLPFRDEFNTAVGYTSDHLAFGDRWFYLYGNKDRLGVKTENGYLDMIGYSDGGGWQTPFLRDDSSSYSGNWLWYGCNYPGLPGDPQSSLSALKAANLASMANGHVLNYEFKVLHNDLSGHFGFSLSFGDKSQARGGIGFETHLIGSWGTVFRAYYSLRSQGKSNCASPDLANTYYDFTLPPFIDQPHTFRWEIDLTNPNYVEYKVYMDGALRYSGGPHYLPTRDAIAFNLYQSAGFWNYETSHSRYEYVNLWRDNERFRFSSFSAKVEAEVGSSSNDDTLAAKGNFALGEESNGINPANEPVKIRIGNFETTIPAGSFKWFEHPRKTEKGEWRFEGTVNAIPMEMKITPTGNNSYAFKFEAESLNLWWIRNPVGVMVNVGDDFGEIEVDPEIEGLENWPSACPTIQTPGISPD